MIPPNIFCSQNGSKGYNQGSYHGYNQYPRTQDSYEDCNQDS